jgi:hypothetical protein
MAERFSGQLTALARFSLSLLKEAFLDNKTRYTGRGEKRAGRRGGKSIQETLPRTKTKVLLFIRLGPEEKKGFELLLSLPLLSCVHMLPAVSHDQDKLAQ